MWNDFTGRAVLVTGGTRGIGLAAGLAFGGAAPHVTLTHKWGSADEAAIRDAFASAGAPQPRIVQADVANDEDVPAVLEGIRRDHDRLEVLVSNVAFGATVRGVDDYSKKALHTGIDYSAWPLVTHTLAARTLFGKAPRYVVGVSSEGADTMHAGYDLIATAKSVLETLCRYLHYRLRDEGTSRQRRAHALRRYDVARRHLRPGVPAFRPPVRTRRAVDARRRSPTRSSASAPD